MKWTKVRFQVEAGEEGGGPCVLAVFPETESPGVVACYARLGQHAVAHPDYVRKLKPAAKEQYEPLAKELASAGYDLEVEGE